MAALALSPDSKFFVEIFLYLQLSYTYGNASTCNIAILKKKKTDFLCCYVLSLEPTGERISHEVPLKAVNAL